MTQIRPSLVALAALLAGCGTERTRTRVDLELEASGRGGGAPLANDFGWSVTLTEARLHLGPIEFHEGEPLLARMWRAIRPVDEAWAHPGHYVPGEALGDVLEASTLDLLGAPMRLGDGNGVSGEYNSAQVVLSSTAELGGHVARLAGRAEKAGARPILFSAEVDVPGPVKGIAFGASIEGPVARLGIEVELSRWVNRIDFSVLSSTTAVTFAPGSQGHNALRRGIASTSAFHFSKRD